MPALVVQSGLAKFNLMLEMNAPGTVPDPLLIAALIDLVSKVENILKGSLDSILSPSFSMKIQIMGRKVCFRCKDKTLPITSSKLSCQ